MRTIAWISKVLGWIAIAFLSSQQLNAQPLCFGGQVSLNGGITSLVQCVQNDNPTLYPESNAAIENDSYFFVLTNNISIIITTFDGSEGIDMDDYPVGTYRIYGFSYTGNLNTATAQPGNPFIGITSDDCFSYSSTFVFVVRNSCESVQCQGGNIFSSDGSTYVSACKDGVADILSFTNTSSGNATYRYVLVDSQQMIQSVIVNDTLDAEILAVGSYSIHGISYSGQLVASTIEAGMPFSGIETNGDCLEWSNYAITIEVIDCELGEGCTHLYFSEYIEGSQNNRALEIYNPTSFPVDLNDYDVFVYTNGSDQGQPVMALSGILQPGEVYVITNSQASEELLAVADITGGVATFSGNDAIALLYNLTPIDVIGVIGEDPGEGWQWSNGNSLASTANRTLVRKATVNAPTTNWELSRGQWLIYPENEFNYIGSHTAASCDQNVYIGFELTNMLVAEDVGTIHIGIQGFNITQPTEVTVTLVAGTATPGVDFIHNLPIELTFTPEVTQHSITLDIVNDVEMEPYEYFMLELVDNSGIVTLVNSLLNITIEHSDQYYPHRTIADVTHVDSFGVGDSINVFCRLFGVVHGENLNPTGVEFTLIENHAGIKVFDADENFGYTVQEGDSVQVCGQVVQFNGMLYLYADSIFYVNSGNGLDSPLEVDQISEENESAMIKLRCVELVNPAQWINQTNGFDVDITNGVNTYTMHIDRDVNLFGMPPLDGHFHVVGIGAQNDEIPPYLDGYSIWPRYLEDIQGRVIARFSPADEIIFGMNGAVVNYENESTGGESYLWNFGDGQTATDENPEHYYPYSFFMGIADVWVSLTVTDAEGCSDTYTDNLDVVYSSIDEKTSPRFTCYPNPFQNILHIAGNRDMQIIHVYDSMGQLIFSTTLHNQLNYEIPTSTWAAGMYMVDVSGMEGASRFRVIKH